MSYGVHQASYANKWYLTRTMSPMLFNIMHQYTPSELFEMWYLHRTESPMRYIICIRIHQANYVKCGTWYLLVSCHRLAAAVSTKGSAASGILFLAALAAEELVIGGIVSGGRLCVNGNQKEISPMSNHKAL